MTQEARINSLVFRPITIAGILFWSVFWLMNGADKFLNGSKVFGLIWFGKDRHEQFGRYCERMGISNDVIDPILTFAGFWEIAVAIFFIMPLVLLIAKSENEIIEKLISASLFLSMLTFIGFCIFDIFVGDRAEPLEHSTYVGVVLVSFLAFEVEKYIAIGLRQNV